MINSWFIKNDEQNSLQKNYNNFSVFKCLFFAYQATLKTIFL